METSFLWFGVFSGSFGIRSIVLCKCSGKYIDIYFKLKITYLTLSFIMLLAAAVENMENLSVILTVRIMLIYLMTQLCERISL